MGVPNEFYLPLVVAIGLFIERSVIFLRYASNRKQWGQRLTEATILGLFFSMISFFIARAFYDFIVSKSEFLSYFLLQYKNLFPSQYSGSLIFCGLLIVLGVFLSNLPYMLSRKKAFYSLLKRFGSPIEKLISSSMSEHRPLILTFANGWSYIVFVTGAPLANTDSSWKAITVVVIQSMYQKGDNVFPIFHDDNNRKLIEDGKYEEVTPTVLVLDDLISMSFFV